MYTHWRRQIAIEDAQRLEVAEIFHYVNKCDWATAQCFARECSQSELLTVINTHPNWRANLNNLER